MARLEKRLTDAQTALATLEELANRNDLSLAERDGAILRLVYTSETMCNVAGRRLEQKEGIAVGSPKATIRGSRRARLLSDDDAENAIRIADDRNLTVHMYKEDLGEAIAGRLVAHAAVLRRWLEALRRRAAAE